MQTPLRQGFEGQTISKPSDSEGKQIQIIKC
jgi:hypothetical protein